MEKNSVVQPDKDPNSDMEIPLFALLFIVLEYNQLKKFTRKFEDFCTLRTTFQTSQELHLNQTLHLWSGTGCMYLSKDNIVILSSLEVKPKLFYDFINKTTKYNI